MSKPFYASLAAWQALWREIHAGQPLQPALPQIDFARRMVVAVFRGMRNDGCAAIQIERTSSAEGQLLVEYSWRDAGKEEACPAYLPSPQHVAVVERSDGATRFQRIAPQAVAFSHLPVALSAFPAHQEGNIAGAPAAPFNRVLRDGQQSIAYQAAYAGQ